jgi:hypothetical protein
MNVSTAAVWTSSDPSIARPEGVGVFLGKSEGQATLTATFDGQTASVPLAVHLQDVLRATGWSEQGFFRTGETATIGSQGFYGVASADSGTLMLVIADQNGMTVAASTLPTVPRGGDRYLLTATFIVSPGTTGVCPTGVLKIGVTTLTVARDVPCLAVMP